MKKVFVLLVFAAIVAAIMKVLQDDAAAEESRMARVKAKATNNGSGADPRAGIVDSVDSAISSAAADVSGAAPTGADEPAADEG